MSIFKSKLYDKNLDESNVENNLEKDITNNLYDYTYQQVKDIPFNSIASTILKKETKIKQKTKTKRNKK